MSVDNADVLKDSTEVKEPVVYKKKVRGAVPKRKCIGSTSAGRGKRITK